jgi:hypothetical protein
LNRCGELQVEKEFPGDTYILRVLPMERPGEDTACEVLERVARDPRFPPMDEIR